MTTIRHATPADADAILSLMAGLGRLSLAADPGPQRAIVLAHLAHPDGAIVVAEGDGQLAGCASLWVRPRLNQVRPEAWLPDLYVRPEQRRQGIANALLDASVAWARERGCFALKLESGHDRAEAHRLHDAYGFDHFGAAYRLPL